MATRKASGEVLNALAPVLPELWGGSADLAGSNNTTMKGEPSFIPLEHQTKMFPGNPYGRTLHFGIREHAMGAILNGIALHGGTRPYGGTFLVFSDYMRPAVRLAALMEQPVTYVWTHDSIGLGEDGPTHQPVEHLWALRAIPAWTWSGPATRTRRRWPGGPSWSAPTTRPALCLTRQNMPGLRPRRPGPGQRRGHGPRRVRAGRGADGEPEVILIATGSEVQIALDARDELQAAGTPARVVSMPCVEWFAEQDRPTRRRCCRPRSGRGSSVEAGVALGWRQFVGDAGESSAWSTSAPRPRTRGCTRSSG